VLFYFVLVENRENPCNINGGRTRTPQLGKPPRCRLAQTMRAETPRQSCFVAALPKPIAEARRRFEWLTKTCRQKRCGGSEADNFGGRHCRERCEKIGMQRDDQQRFLTPFFFVLLERDDAVFNMLGSELNYVPAAGCSRE
jgi:hypothetical protein